jgi:hypothetical protein
MAHDPESICRALATLSGSWSWDGRFGAAVAAFDAGQAAATEAAVAAQLDARWGSADLGGAPQRVRALVGKLGGMRGDQSLFTHEHEGTLVWCAWWPWQSGTKFSLRVGVDGPSAPDPRAWFGA